MSLSLCPSHPLTHPPLKSVLSGWSGFMSRVIKRRGDEGQRGKERWRTEGDAGIKRKKRQTRNQRWEQGWSLLLHSGCCPTTSFPEHNVALLDRVSAASMVTQTAGTKDSFLQLYDRSCNLLLVLLIYLASLYSTSFGVSVVEAKQNYTIIVSRETVLSVHFKNGRTKVWCDFTNICRHSEITSASSFVNVERELKVLQKYQYASLPSIKMYSSLGRSGGLPQRRDTKTKEDKIRMGIKSDEKHSTVSRTGPSSEF